MKPLIVANWKMNPVTFKEAKRNFGLIKKELKKIKNTDPVRKHSFSNGVNVVICPPFVFLPVLTPDQNVKLGGQDCFWEEEKGSFTSAISPMMLKNLGCQYVILGHSERRVYFKETDEIINKKIKAALKAGLKVILCVGEKKAGKLQEMERQLKKDLERIKKYDINNLILAYEPIWAISGFGGRPASAREARQGAVFVRKVLNKIFSGNLSKRIKILYGGSASQNPRSYIYTAGMDGLVIGSSSAKAKEFINLLKDVSGSK